MDKYLENVKLNSEGIYKVGSVIELNKEVQNKLIEDVTEINFTNLYANLLIKFHENDIFVNNNIIIDESIIERVKAFLYIRQGKNAIANAQVGTDEWKEWCYTEKVWINKLYIEELKSYTPMIFELYRQYMKQVFDDIVKYNPYTWLYLDTDHFFITGKFTHVNEETTNLFKQIGLPSDITYHNFIYIDKLKQYITGDRAKIAERGKPIYKREDIIAIMKQKIREIKINDLFIE